MAEGVLIGIGAVVAVAGLAVAGSHVVAATLLAVTGLHGLAHQPLVTEESLAE